MRYVFKAKADEQIKPQQSIKFQDENETTKSSTTKNPQNTQAIYHNI